MATRGEVEDLVLKYIREGNYKKADALYMWSLCHGSFGFCYSFELKYGSVIECSEISQELRKILGEYITGYEKTEDSEEYVVDIVRKTFEKHYPHILYEEVVKHLEEISDHAKKLLLILYRDGTIFLSGKYLCDIWLDRIINRLLKKVFTIDTIKELLSTGILLACFWTPRDQSYHIYQIPIYSLNIWKNIPNYVR